MRCSTPRCWPRSSTWPCAGSTAAALYAERVAAGEVCDGHGDLRGDNVFCLDDGPRILDCIEFDDHLRHVDVWNDVAFLVMDLERLGRPDLADVLRDTYREMSADTALPGLIDVFVAYRALVRAKVAGLRSHQTEPGPEREACLVEARARLSQCLDHLRRARIRLVLVGGLPGTGKSTLASELAESLGAAVLSSDPLRKELVGATADVTTAADYRGGAYSAEVTDATYAALRDRARVLLARGESVILDASWIDDRQRAATRSFAVEVGAEMVELRCTCPADLAAARIAARRAAGDRESDAGHGCRRRRLARRGAGRHGGIGRCRPRRCRRRRAQRRVAAPALTPARGGRRATEPRRRFRLPRPFVR